jgi:uncharacterized protein YkwD
MVSRVRRIALLVAATLSVSLVSVAPLTAPAEAHGDRNQFVMDGFNGLRSEVGLGWVGGDACLQAAAQARAVDMVTRRYFGHVTPDGASFTDVLNYYGCGWYAAGEIIERNNYPADQALWVALRDFRNSPAHYRIITGGYNVAGAYVVNGPDGMTYTVGIFILR